SAGFDPPDDARKDARMGEGARTRDILFVSGKTAQGMSVKGAEHKTLGTIDDMIIDRGSGRIRFLVLKSGTVMGLGGKLVTVPYGSFARDYAGEHVTLAATPDEIKAWFEFDKKRWMEGARSADGYIRTIGKDYYDRTDSPWPAEVRGTTSDIRGTVKN